ncbi:MAG: pyridoxamine 5'-phosphate oxidase family protein [Candidatus Binatia bacterium]
MLAATDARVRTFLRRSSIVQVATLSPKKRPFVTPLWFILHDGAVYITSGYESRAGRNVQQHAEVTLLFVADRRAHADQVLRLRGTATCHRGYPPWGVLWCVVMKYYLSPRALVVELRNARKWRLRKRYYGQAKGGAGYLRVIPGACEFLRRP